MTPTPTFHLGLTMAGAVSGGAYTAGVMDYLFETLDEWQRIKDVLNKKNAGAPLNEDEEELVKLFRNKIPEHNVMIDVLGGASAGGMTSSMAMLAAFKKFPSISKPLPERSFSPTGNIFYDSWVMLRDTANQPTIEKLLNTKDLEANDLQSVLNSDVVDEIANDAYKGANEIDLTNGRKYFSKDLQLILTLCSLTGIPLKINFSVPGIGKVSDPVPGHEMQYHALKAHFKPGKSNHSNHFLKLDFQNEQDVELWKLCSIATGAFPFGLKYRKISLPGEYVKCDIERSVLGAGNPVPLTWSADFPKDFGFTAVDGGTLDNEPFGAARNVLESIAPNVAGQPSNYGIIMIDPFPNFEEEKEWVSTVHSVFNVIPNLYSTLRHQAMFKQTDFLETIKSDYPRYEIYPSKYDRNWQKLKFPLACGSVGAFGGFLHFKFREHDYFLGRDNCKYFLRYFFCLQYDPKASHPIHRNWTGEMLERFTIYRNGNTYLPIVPDPSIIRQNIRLNQRTLHPEYTCSELPEISAEEILKYESAIKVRVKAVVLKAALQLIKTNGGKKWYHPLFPPITNMAMNLFGAKIITDKILRKIICDLQERGLIKSSE